MDFVDWCGLVLDKLIELSRTDLQARSIGVHESHFAQALFGNKPESGTGIWGSEQRDDLHRAVNELIKVELVENSGRGNFWKVTRSGRQMASEITPLWEDICQPKLESEQEQLLQLVNRLSPHATNNSARVRWVRHEDLLSELQWPGGMDLLWPVAEELEELDLIERHATMGPNLQLRATYRGLVWETRRGSTLESRFIDDLVAEWETTSVEFKREVHTKTASEKAELIKDVLGLVNTQSSGRRWLIIGFDPKTHAYYGPPDPKLDQDHFEQLLAQYTVPIVGVRYDVVEYRAGPVGRLEVLRDRRNLPYKVAKSIGDKSSGKRIEQDQIFVRHGSQTEEPTEGELQAIVEEGDRARANPQPPD